MSAPTATPSLWSLEGDAAAFAELLDSLGPTPAEDDLEALDSFFESLVEAIEAKTGATVHVIRALEAQAAAQKDHAKTINELARAKENGAKRLRARLRDTLAAAGHHKVEGVWGRAQLRKPGGKTPLNTDPAAIPARFKVERVVVELDEKAIRAALEAGEDVPGAYLVTDRPLSLVLKA